MVWLERDIRVELEVLVETGGAVAGRARSLVAEVVVVRHVVWGDCSSLQLVLVCSFAALASL